MAIPSFLKRLRGGTAVPDRSDGRSDLLAQDGPSPPSGTGRAGSICSWKSSADDARRRLVASSQAEPSSASEPIQEEQPRGGSWGGPVRHCYCSNKTSSSPPLRIERIASRTQYPSAAVGKSRSRPNALPRSTSARPSWPTTRNRTNPGCSIRVPRRDRAQRGLVSPQEPVYSLPFGALAIPTTGAFRGWPPSDPSKPALP